MINDMDIRAARAMGWEPHLDANPPYFKMPNGEVRTMEATSFRSFVPSADANNCRELLQEVEKQGLGVSCSKNIWELFIVYKISDKVIPSVFDYLIAPLPVIVRAAVEALEATAPTS